MGGRQGWGQKQVWEKGAIVAEPQGLRGPKWTWRAEAIDGSQFPGGGTSSLCMSCVQAGPNPLGAAAEGAPKTQLLGSEGCPVGSGSLVLEARGGWRL